MGATSPEVINPLSAQSQLPAPGPTTRIPRYQFAWAPLPLGPTRRPPVPLALGPTGQPALTPEPLTALARLSVRALAHARVLVRGFVLSHRSEIRWPRTPDTPSPGLFLKETLDFLEINLLS
jgi:hypothetical protein